MATMKYIGARYMPKFMGTYDAATAYEALSVVDNGVGTTYVANKPVPAGTPLTDTDYWAIYGASSGAILDLQNRMTGAENDIGVLQGDMTSAQGDILTNAGNITLLDNIIQLKGKTIAIFGASNEIASFTQDVNWTDLLAAKLTGYATVVNKSVGGRTLTTAITDYINDPDKYSYDIIIFCCTKNLFLAQSQADVGSSDLVITNNIESGIASLESYRHLSQTFYFASCTPFRDSFRKIPMCIYDGTVKKSAEFHGHKTLDMHSWLGCSDYDSYDLTYDGIHFKAEVEPIIAEKCLKALLAGGETIANYACRLSGSAVYNYLQSNTTLTSGLTDGQSGMAANYQHKFYCDTDLNVRMVICLKNETGAQLNIGSNIFSVSGLPTVLRTAFMCNVKNVGYKLSSGYILTDILVRPERVTTETVIETNTYFMIIFGDIKNAYCL